MSGASAGSGRSTGHTRVAGPSTAAQGDTTSTAAAPTRVCLAVQHPLSWVAAWLITRLSNVVVDDGDAGLESETSVDDALASLTEPSGPPAATPSLGAMPGLGEQHTNGLLAPVPRARVVGLLTDTLHMLFQRLSSLAQDSSVHLPLQKLVETRGACLRVCVCVLLCVCACACAGVCVCACVWVCSGVCVCVVVCVLCATRSHSWLCRVVAVATTGVFALQLVRRRTEYVCCLAQYHRIAGVLATHLVGGPVLATRPTKAAAFFARSGVPLATALAALTSAPAPSMDAVSGVAVLACWCPWLLGWLVV